MTLMTTSNKGKDLIKKYEGLRLEAYRCPAGIPTIGWGHTKGVKMGMKITQGQAEDYLIEDIAPCEKVLNNLKINFRQEQFDACVSFIFNLGSSAFTNSTLCKKIQKGANNESIASEFIRWINAGGKPQLGLKKHRVDEANMFVGYNIYKIDKEGNIKKV